MAEQAIQGHRGDSCTKRKPPEAQTPTSSLLFLSVLEQCRPEGAGSQKVTVH